MQLTKETIAEMKNSVNIVDVIGEVVALSKTGRQYLGLCPFHKEKTPSFNVLEDRQFFHCFGCGKSGDVFKFLEEYRQIPFLEAAQIVAERAGLSFSIESNHATQREKHPNQVLFDINRDAAKFFNAVLMTTKLGEPARQYLYKRGLSDEDLTYFNIGLAPDDSNLLYQALSKNWEENNLLQSGLFTLSEQNHIFDAFRGRLMFPLNDENGRIVGFSGRIWQEKDSLEKKAKYKNTRSTAIFNKSVEFYHLDKAKPVINKQHEVYLMEGFMDVIAAHRSGIQNAIASMGTALTQEHVNRLRKLTKKVVLAYDGDAAGQEAITKALDLLQGFTIEIVKFPNKMDPDDYLQKNSKEDLHQLLTESRMSQIEFLIYHLLPQNTDNLQAEIRFVEKMAPMIAVVQSITAQNTYIKLLADLLPDFDYYQIEQAVNNERLAKRNMLSQSQSGFSTYVDLPVTKRLTALERAENHLFHRLIHHEGILNTFRLRDDFEFKNPDLENLYDILKRDGEIDRLLLDQLPESSQQVYYQVLAENLPDEPTQEEIEEILQQRERCLIRQELADKTKQSRSTDFNDDIDDATLALEQMIAQKRKME